MAGLSTIAFDPTNKNNEENIFLNLLAGRFTPSSKNVIFSDIIHALFNQLTLPKLKENIIALIQLIDSKTQQKDLGKQELNPLLTLAVNKLFASKQWKVKIIYKDTEKNIKLNKEELPKIVNFLMNIYNKYNSNIQISNKKNQESQTQQGLNAEKIAEILKNPENLFDYFNVENLKNGNLLKIISAMADENLKKNLTEIEKIFTDLDLNILPLIDFNSAFQPIYLSYLNRLKLAKDITYYETLFIILRHALDLSCNHQRQTLNKVKNQENNQQPRNYEEEFLKLLTYSTTNRIIKDQDFWIDGNNDNEFNENLTAWFQKNPKHISLLFGANFFQESRHILWMFSILEPKTEEKYEILKKFINLKNQNLDPAGFLATEEHKEYYRTFLNTVIEKLFSEELRNSPRVAELIAGGIINWTNILPQFTKFVQAIQKLQREIQTLTSQNQNITASSVGKIKELKEKIKELEKTNNATNAISAALETVKENQNEQNNKNQKLQELIESLKSTHQNEINNLKLEITNLKQTIAQLKAQNQNKDKKIAELEATLKAQNRENQKKDDEIARLKAELEVQNQANQNKDKKITELTAQLEAQNQENRADQNLIQQNQDLIQENKNLIQQNQDLIQENKNLKTKIAELPTIINTLKIKTGELQKQADKLKNQYQQSQGNLEKQKEKNQELITQNNNLTKEIVDLGTRISNLINELAQYKNSDIAWQNYAKNLQTTIQTLSQQIQTLSIEPNALYQTIQTLQQMIAYLTTINHSLAAHQRDSSTLMAVLVPPIEPFLTSFPNSSGYSTNSESRTSPMQQLKGFSQPDQTYQTQKR